MVVEIPRFSQAKFEINRERPLNPIRQDVTAEVNGTVERWANLTLFHKNWTGGWNCVLTYNVPLSGSCPTCSPGMGMSATTVLSLRPGKARITRLVGKVGRQTQLSNEGPVDGKDRGQGPGGRLWDWDFAKTNWHSYACQVSLFLLYKTFNLLVLFLSVFHLLYAGYLEFLPWLMMMRQTGRCNKLSCEILNWFIIS